MWSFVTLRVRRPMWIRLGLGVGERSLRLRSLDRERDFESRLSRLRRPRDVERDFRASLSALVLSVERLSFVFVELSLPSLVPSLAGLFDVDLRFGRERPRSLLDELLELLEELLDEELLEPEDEREELLSDELATKTNKNI